MVIVTGGAGFIGSAVVWRLNLSGITDIVVVDHLGATDKWRNLVGRRFADYLDKADFLAWLQTKGQSDVELIIHMGACADTTQSDAGYLMQNNFAYSQHIWRWCVQSRVPLIYASSAATYGSGDAGYAEDHSNAFALEPLNPYGFSKSIFDSWALAQQDSPPAWAGLKFFNVFGPNEYHKGSMASVALHVYRQLREDGACRLFRSHRADCADGEQKRDFVYVKDVVDIIEFLRQHPCSAGLLNIGTGTARSFNELVRVVSASAGIEPNIEFVDIPLPIRNRYQYFTEARINKLRQIGYTRPFTSLEAAVEDYVVQYLAPGEHRL